MEKWKEHRSRHWLEGREFEHLASLYFLFIGALQRCRQGINMDWALWGFLGIKTLKWIEFTWIKMSVSTEALKQAVQTPENMLTCLLINGVSFTIFPACAVITPLCQSTLFCLSERGKSWMGKAFSFDSSILFGLNVRWNNKSYLTAALTVLSVGAFLMVHAWKCLCAVSCLGFLIGNISLRKKRNVFVFCFFCKHLLKPTGHLT